MYFYLVNNGKSNDERLAKKWLKQQGQTDFQSLADDPPDYLNRAQPCLFAILGFLPFRIPACIVPILSWNVLSVWTRCFPVNGIYLGVSFVAV